VSSVSSTSSPLPAASGPQRLAYAFLLAVLCGTATVLGSGADAASRAAGLRLWTVAGAGLFAMAPPNVLQPDPNTPLLQLLNWSPTRLLRYQLRRLAPLLVLTGLPAVLLALADPTAPLQHLPLKMEALAQALLLLLGTAADSFVHFATLGPRSQAWQEGTGGEWYAQAVEEQGQGVSLPRGLVPALFATTRCFVVALGAIIVSAAGAQAGLTTVAWAPGLVLLGWASLRLWNKRSAYDRYFYQTTAFYDEVMGGGTLRSQGRDPIPYDALYWVPPRWRPATWAGLRQLDRRLPLGRLVALGHAGLWLLCLQDLPALVITGYLGLLFTAQTATCGLLTTRSAAPLAFQRTLQSTADWIGTRTFVNLRWGAAHAGSLAVVAFFDAGYAWPWLLTWIAVHVGLSITTAAIATLAHEGGPRQAA
jgi:hypothetical protein